nr:transposase [uncultured Desulfobulbus sp.]
MTCAHGNLDYHPHIHVVMPAASINQKTGLWKERSGKYLFSHKALAKVFRAKFLQSLVEHELPVPSDCPEQWVVDCKDVGTGEKALVYLGRSLVRNQKQQPAIICPTCGATMVIIATMLPRPPTLAAGSRP